MTLADFSSKRTVSPPSKKKRPRLSRANKHPQNGPLKKLQASVFDRLHVRQPMDKLENKSIHQQQRKEPLPLHPSIIKSSDIARVLSKKSVTFASVFDHVDSEHDMIWKLEPTNDKEITFEKDLVTVLTNSPIDDRTTVERSETTEPYPFRSEIPTSLTSSSNLPTNLGIATTTTSHRSQKKIIDHFTPHHRPKKLRHPLEIIDPISSRNRPTSTPNSALSSPPIRTSPVPADNQQSPSKTNTRTRSKLSSIVQFIRSFGAHSHKKQTNETIRTRISPHRSSSGLKSNSEFLY